MVIFQRMKVEKTKQPEPLQVRILCVQASVKQNDKVYFVEDKRHFFTNLVKTATGHDCTWTYKRNLF